VSAQGGGAPARTAIALGANVGDRLAQLRAARRQIFALENVSEPFLSSRIYETEPVGTEPEAGAFFNAVIEVGYAGSPSELLAALQSIERQMGRPSKRPRNAPRNIDLDILYCGDLVLAEDDVEIPHPRLHLRRFVLTPLADIRPEFVLPGQSQSVAALLAGLHDPAGVKLSNAPWEP
jgi:2-amino-4-hydroxy-6-hydroxymethyldihydropteridine diphosphokinase